MANARSNSALVPTRTFADRMSLGAGKDRINLKPEQAMAVLRRNPGFTALLKDRLLTGMEYGGTPESRALITMNVAYQELEGEPVTTNFGPPPPDAPPPPASNSHRRTTNSAGEGETLTDGAAIAYPDTIRECVARRHSPEG